MWNFNDKDMGFPPRSSTDALTWGTQETWVHIPHLLDLDWRLGCASSTKEALLICHGLLSLPPAQIVPLFHKVNRIDLLDFAWTLLRAASLRQYVFLCLGLTHFKQPTMKMALLLLGEVCSLFPGQKHSLIRSFFPNLCSFLLLCLPWCPLLSRKSLPASIFSTLQSLAYNWGHLLSFLLYDLGYLKASYWGFPVFIEDGESCMVLLRKLQFPSPGKYPVDFCNSAETSSLLHNTQTNNPHTVYHKSLDPVFEFGSLISCKYIWKPIRSFDHINLLLCTISLKSLSEKFHISVRRDTGEGFSLSEVNYFWEDENFVQLCDSNIILASLTWKRSPTVS